MGLFYHLLLSPLVRSSVHLLHVVVQVRSGVEWLATIWTYARRGRRVGSRRDSWRSRSEVHSFSWEEGVNCNWWADCCEIVRSWNRMYLWQKNACRGMKPSYRIQFQDFVCLPNTLSMRVCERLAWSASDSIAAPYRTICFHIKRLHGANAGCHEIRLQKAFSKRNLIKPSSISAFVTEHLRL